jgi:hypothetical protein
MVSRSAAGHSARSVRTRGCRRLSTFPLALVAIPVALLGAWAGEPTASPRTMQLRPRQVGAAADALRLPDRASNAQTSRGWQFLSAPVAPGGGRATLAASDGVYWNLELRALVRKRAEEPFVGLVFRYENERHYATLLWDTKSGTLTLRTFRDRRGPDLATGKAEFGPGPWASVVLRAVMGSVVCYVNGSKVLEGSEPSLLGRAAVFVVGGESPQLEGLEVRALDTNDADADVFGRSRAEFETKCRACHELNGPWNANYAPDDWESVVNGMLATEHADRVISRKEANRIIDYLRIISLHPDRGHYRPREEM